ncbi:MAG: tocopherol cyclase family protein [Spirochaetales bacterium]|nr:tocopherol cyclase family protein [Spirochaetales bacterium]
MDNRNAYMLNKSNHKKNYDWWWHSLVAENEKTGELEPFFIEYYVINPGIASESPVFGQLPGQSQKPCYAMIKAGKWGEDKAQIHNFYAISDFSASKEIMDVKIGANTATEKHLEGAVSMSVEDAAAHPEYMSDAGDLSWNLEAEKVMSYSVGFGASPLLRRSNLFDMFWHIQGMKTLYNGTINFNGQKYRVRPETSAGYQDKNWGRDYTNPWIWLNCNRFFDQNGSSVESASLDIGGGNPRVAGIDLGEKILVAFRYEGKLYEFNFTHLFFQKQIWSCNVESDTVFWNVDVFNKTHHLKVRFSAPRKLMVLVKYENPDGKVNHKELWNGGHASGFVELYSKNRKKEELVCHLDGELGGCEYGRY